MTAFSRVCVHPACNSTKGAAGTHRDAHCPAQSASLSAAVDKLHFSELRISLLAEHELHEMQPVQCTLLCVACLSGTSYMQEVGAHHGARPLHQARLVASEDQAPPLLLLQRHSHALLLSCSCLLQGTNGIHPQQGAGTEDRSLPCRPSPCIKRVSLPQMTRSLPAYSFSGTVKATSMIIVSLSIHRNHSASGRSCSVRLGVQ